MNVLKVRLCFAGLFSHGLVFLPQRKQRVFYVHSVCVAAVLSSNQEGALLQRNQRLLLKRPRNAVIALRLCACANCKKKIWMEKYIDADQHAWGGYG